MPEPAPEPECPLCSIPREGDYCEGCGRRRDDATPLQDSRNWFAVAHADHEYFQFVCATGGPGVASIEFPRFCPERRFQLRGETMLIGRRSASRGVDPKIDLTGPPEDAAIGRSHALLVCRPDRTWSIVDLESTNGTYLNDYRSLPLQPHKETSLSHEDRLYLGAWTRLTIRLND